jgi:hypothetical protein
VEPSAHRAPDQRLILTRIQRRLKSLTPRRLSKITLAVTGSTLVTAAVASGLVVLWPSAPPGLSATSSLTAASASLATQAGGQVGRGGSGTVASQTLMARTQSAQRRQQSLAVAAQLAAAQRAAARRQAERRAAAAAAQRAAAAARQARQAAQQSSQQQPSQPSAPPPASSAPPVPSGSAQQIALGMLGSYGWSSGQFSCLDSLWNQESGWNVEASNPSGAYGIPQALPGSKMASAGPDWQTDAATQIRWGLGYIKGTYGSPCNAWAHEEADGWY